MVYSLEYLLNFTIKNQISLKMHTEVFKKNYIHFYKKYN